jgi:hypothetical protein
LCSSSITAKAAFSTAPLIILKKCHPDPERSEGGGTLRPSATVPANKKATKKFRSRFPNKNAAHLSNRKKEPHNRIRTKIDYDFGSTALQRRKLPNLLVIGTA